MTNPNPYHVRLAISQYGDQFRAELFTEDLGDTEGKELLPSIKNLPVGNAQDGDATTFAQWLESLAGGQVAFDAEQLRNIGRVLFKYLLGSAENLEKWQAICAQATDQHRDIRLLIDATTPDTYDLPYGLLCEQNGKFLFQPESDRLAIQFVRILRQSTPRMLQLGRKPLRLLVVAAEPQGLEVGCANYLCQLLRGLGERYAVTLCDTEGTYPLPEVVTGSSDAWQPAQFTRFCRTTRTVLKRTLQGGTYDLLHVIAHGVGTGLIVCTADGARDEVTSGDFGNWCRASQIQLAFLQVCKSGQAGTRGAFGGIAQKLVSPQFGNLAAVVASPYPIDPAQSTQVAMQFYQRLLTEAELHPDLALWRSFPDDEGDWRLWALLELWVRPRALSDTGTRGYFQFPSPYRGLARFEERDAEIFFGRDAEILDLLNIISQEPVVAVVGDSGSGKSSLLQAGVCARMRRDGPEIGTDWSKSVDPSKRTDWRIVSLTPGEKPAQSLVLALGGPTPDQPDEAALRQAFAQVRQAAQPLLLVFDQFEELFTLCDNPAERQAVSTVLAEEAQQHLDQFRLILGMRSEYLGAAAKLPGLNARISRPWLLKFPDASNVQAIVAQPAYYHGYTFENGLLAKILTDPLLTTGAAPLPLLEFALERLWLKAVERGSQEFTHKDYDDLGGMVGAIARHADEVYEYLPTSFSELGTAAQHVAEQILTGLVTTSGTRHTRRPRPRHGLEVETGNPELARQVLDRLVGERLLTLRRNPNQPDDALVDLSHEVLLTRWEKLQQWLALDPEGRAMKEAFQKDLDRWAQGLPDTPAKSPQLLPNADVVATDYLAWIDSKKPTLTPAQKDFTDELRNLLRRKAEVEEEQRRKQEEQRQQKLEAAQKLAAAEAQARQEAEQRVAEQKKSNQRLRRRAFGLVVVFLIAVVAAIVAVNLAIKTVRQTQIAQINEIEALTQTSKALFLSHDELGALLVGIKAGKSAKQAGAPTILISQISAVLQEVVYGVHEKNRLEGHTSTSDVYTVALSPDGATLALGGEDQTIRLWRIADGHELNIFRGHSQRVWSVAFSPDGTTLASGSADATIKLWRVADGQELRTFRGHSERVLSVAFSPDGATLASSSADRTIKLWRIADGQELKTFRGHSERVLSVAFNPLDGTILASGSADKTIKLWRIAADMAFKTFQGHSKEVFSVAFSPDGRTLVSGSADQTIKLWQVADGEEPKTFQGHSGTVYSVAFSPDGTTLASGSDDRTIKLWRIADGHELHTFQGHSFRVMSVKFTPDGKLLVSGSYDNTVRLWNVLDDRLQGHSKKVFDVAFSPDGTILASGSADRTIKLWRVADGMELKTLQRHSDTVNSVAFSPDGATLASGSNDQMIKLWRVADGQELHTFQEHSGGFGSIAFSPDGTTLASGSNDNTITLWRAADGQMLQSFRRHSARLWSVVFSPDGRTLASGSADATIKLWRVADGQELRTFRGHSSAVLRVAFSPDGATLASGSADATIKLWRVADGKELNTFYGHSEKVLSVAFSPDGATLASSSSDQTIKLWRVADGQVLNTFRWHSDEVWTVAFSRDGKLMASGSADTTIKLWHIDLNDLLAQGCDWLHGYLRTNPGLNDADRQLCRDEDIATYKKQVAAQPAHADVWHEMGLAFYAQGKFDEALAACQHQIQVTPTHQNAWNCVGQVFSAQGQWGEAIRAFQQQIDITPDHETAWQNMGNALNKQGKVNEAIAAYQKQAEIFQANGKLVEAVVAYQRLLEIQPDHQMALLNMGHALQDDKRMNEAIDAYQKFVALRPDDKNAWNNLGNVFSKQGRWDEAIAAYQKQVEVKPDHADAWNNLGNAFFNQGKWDESIAAYQQQGKVTPIHVYAWNNLGNVFFNQGKWDEAIVAYQKQVDVKPDHMDAWNNLGNAFFNEGKWDDAIAAYQKQVEVTPEHVYAWNNLGNAFFNQGKWDDAIAAYQKQVEVTPEHVYAWNNLGNVFSKQGRWDEAITAYQKQIEVKRENTNWHWLGYAFLKQGNLAEAANVLANGLNGNPNDISLLSSDVRLAFVQGDLVRCQARIATVLPLVKPDNRLFAILPFYAYLTDPTQGWERVLTAIEQMDLTKVEFGWDFTDTTTALTRLDANTQQVAQHFIAFFKGEIDLPTLKERLSK